MKAKKIFIFGASGFVGGLLFKQFNRFYNTLGTYCTQENTYGNNRKFTSFKVAEDSAYELLESVRPSIIISVIRGPFDALITMHSHLVQYANDFDCKIVFISSANVFDTYSKYPSYEFDKTLSESVYGRFQIKIEHSLQKIPKENLLLLRAPMVFGPQSPRVKEIKQLILDKAPIEVFPNLIINVSSGEKLCQQILLLLNQDRFGTYHLGSSDLVPHEEFIQEIVHKLRMGNPVYKRIYTTNENRYLAVLSKDNPLPQEITHSYKDCLDAHY